MSNLCKKSNLMKSTLAAIGLAWCGVSMALPSTCMNYSVTNATLSDGGSLSGTWSVDWTMSPPALSVANLSVTGGTAGYAGDNFVIPGTINYAFGALSGAPVSGTFYATNFNATSNNHNIWLMFDVDTGALKHFTGPNYLSLNGGTSAATISSLANIGTPTAAVASQCPTATPSAIPTLDEWAMIFMASLMAMFGIRRIRRSK